MAVAFIQKVLFAVLMFLLFLTVPLVIFLFVAIFAAPEGTWMMLSGAVLGLALLGLVAWAFETCRRSPIPHSFRQIGQFPFFLYGLRNTA
jgi:hypothetical protein